MKVIIFVVTKYNELRIVEADTFENGIKKTGGIVLFAGSVKEDLYKKVIDEDFVICVALENRSI